jgi:choline kinase
MLDARNIPHSASTTSLPQHFDVPLRDIAKEEEDTQEAIRLEVDRLRYETRMWRGVNSAQWVLWGVVQAKVPGMPDFDEEAKSAKLKEQTTPDADSTPRASGKAKSPQSYAMEKEALIDKADTPILGAGAVVTTPEAVDLDEHVVTQDAGAPDQEAKGEETEDDEDGFDYLSYSHERAMFFWGDVIAMGIMSKEELPEEVLRIARVLEY